MSAIQHLLRRMGFVKLRSYGLALTTDGRIVSTRGAVLDDGAGGPIVGWQDGDVAIWKLSRWADPPPEPVVFAAATPAPPPPPSPPPVAPSAHVMSAEVAAEPAVDEDDWEWTIALARARAAVEEVEAALPPEYDDYRVSTRPGIEIPKMAAPPATLASPVTPAPPPPPAAASRAGTPHTVIPVPALPSVDAALCSRLEPVIRSTQQLPSLASRVAKGTGPVDPPNPPRPPALLLEDTVPELSIGDRTHPGVAPAPRPRPPTPPPARAGERTQPGIALPSAARTVALPSIKRRSLPR